MNSILMVIGALVVILVVFIIFSQDDADDEIDSSALDPIQADSSTPSPDSTTPVASDGSEPGETRSQPVTASSDPRIPVPGTAPASLRPQSSGEEPGIESELELRCQIDDTLPPPTEIKTFDAVVVVAQLRFPEEILQSPGTFLPLLAASEAILNPEKSLFPHSQFSANQLDRLWIFGNEENRDDPVLEALVTCQDTISRFKKALEGNQALAQARARLAMGVSMGPVTRISRGPMGAATHAGKALYVAESLGEIAGDFQIYIDSEVHRLAQPLFDFREWKPMKLRALSQISFFEVVGWNKKEDIFAFASHKDPLYRRAVAVAFRYLEFDDSAPLFSLLTDSDEKVVQEALSTVAEIGDERAQGILKKILPEVKTPQMRSAVIEALSSTSREDILPVLLAATKDVNWQVRFQAVRGLNRIAGKDAQKHMEPLRQDENGAVRAMVLESFYLQSRDPKDLKALGDLLTDLSTRARRSAMEAMGRINTTESLGLLAQSYRQQEPEQKRFLLKTLAATKSGSVFPCFLRLFQNADERERAEIVQAIRRARLAG